LNILRTACLLALIACRKEDPTPTQPVTSASPRGPGAAASAPGEAVASGKAGERVKFDAAEIAVPPGKSALHVQWSVPSGTAINDDAPFTVRWGSSDGLVSPPGDIRGHGKDVEGGFDVPIELMAGSSGGQLAGDIDLVVCDVETHAVCVPLKRRLELTFAVGKGNAKGNVTLPLPRAKPK
jgi:hypothetical protein